MKHLIICIFSICFYFSCVNAQNKTLCPEGINVLPLYGNVEKCQEQKDADANFLSYCDKEFSSRKQAAIEQVKMAWSYTEQNDRDRAIKRFNQAWLLDPTNADLYWGLGIIQGSKSLYDEAEQLFEQSLALNLTNEKVWYCLAVNNKEKYEADDTQEQKDKRIQYLEKALNLNPTFNEAVQMIRKEDGTQNVGIESVETKGKDKVIKHTDGTSIIISIP